MVIKRFVCLLPCPDKQTATHNLLSMDLVLTFMQHGGVHVTVGKFPPQSLLASHKPQIRVSHSRVPPVSPLASSTKLAKFQSFFACNEAAIWAKVLQYVKMLSGRQVLAK